MCTQRNKLNRPDCTTLRCVVADVLSGAMPYQASDEVYILSGRAQASLSLEVLRKQGSSDCLDPSATLSAKPLAVPRRDLLCALQRNWCSHDVVHPSLPQPPAWRKCLFGARESPIRAPYKGCNILCHAAPRGVYPECCLFLRGNGVCGVSVVILLFIGGTLLLRGVLVQRGGLLMGALLGDSRAYATPADPNYRRRTCAGSVLASLH
eukprot:1710869-Amphidinium_carterae.3